MQDPGLDFPHEKTGSNEHTFLKSGELQSKTRLFRPLKERTITERGIENIIMEVFSMDPGSAETI